MSKDKESKGRPGSEGRGVGRGFMRSIRRGPFVSVRLLTPSKDDTQLLSRNWDVLYH